MKNKTFLWLAAITLLAGTATAQNTFPSNGFVGIGTGSPAYQLDIFATGNATSFRVNGTTNPLFAYALNGSVKLFIGLPTQNNNFINGSTAVTDACFRLDGGGKIMFSTSATGATNDMTIVGNKVGIGTTVPSNTLDVNGTAHISSDITVDGNIAAKYQDVAEWVPVTQQIPSATVVVLDPKHSNHVIPSTSAYDATVAGVVSAKPGLTLGEGSDSKVKVATTGRVKVKVDASAGAIAIGDLLVTSDKPGIAMKSTPVEISGIKFHRPGTLIGKALEPLDKGQGEILVLLSLQ